MTDKSVSPRKRSGEDLGKMSLEKFKEMLDKEIESKKID
jgi:threonyl-tRNA synthetase